MSIAYGIMLIMAVTLLVLYCSLIRKKEKWLLVLFVSGCIVNLGYLLLSVSKTVGFALFSNKIAYLGHIFMLLSMYLTITKLCGLNYTNKLPIALVLISVAVFGMVATTGYLPWYYKSVTITHVDGATKLIKEYGPLHVVYLFYVLFYFTLIVSTVAWSICTKKVCSKKQAGLLSAIVLCNIAMWIIEKFVTWNFEFLSLSYILSEGMLFFLYWMMQDYVHKDEIPTTEKTRVIVLDSIPKAEKLERVLSLLPDGKKLTTRQMEMLEGILDGKSHKEIASDLNISENTVKWHIGLLYSSLNVSGREELFKILK